MCFKLLMTSPTETVSFVSPRPSMLRVEGKQNFLFPEGPVIKCFVIPPEWKIEKTAKKWFAWRLRWLTNLLRFQRTRPGHVRVESSSCCFARELVSCVRPRELGCVPLRWSGSGSVIQDHWGHGLIKGTSEATLVPWSKWSWITDPDPDHPKGTQP